MKKPKLIIFGDNRRPNVAEAIQDFLAFCQGRAQILANCFQDECAKGLLDKADFAVVFGGDGTILGAARELSETNVPVIGVNIGKLGYLAEFNVGELTTLFERAVTDASLIERRMMLKCEIRQDGHMFVGTAVNDVVINAGEPFRMIELKMTIGGAPLASCFGDGIIISTPTGSTAYNLSAGGPILSANLSAIVVTPICPHSLSFRPIVVSAEHAIDVHVMRANEGTTVTLDGQVSQKLNFGDVIEVKKHSGALRVVSNPMRTQWDTLAGKLNWAGRPNYNVEARQINE